MGTSYRVVNHLDERSWREFVDANGGGIFQTPQMYEVFRRTDLHEPELWATVDNNDEPMAMFLAVDISVFGARPLRSLSTRTVAYAGASARSGTDGTEALETLLGEYRARQRDALFTEFRNVTDASDLQDAYESEGAAFEDHLNYLIHLEEAEEELWSRIKSSARRNIRKAYKAGVEVRPVTDPEQFDLVYGLLADTYRRIEVPLPDISLFRSTFDVLQPRGELQVLGAFFEGKLIADLFLLTYGGIATYWYTGSLREYGKLRANDLLVWEAIQTAKRSGASVFDFGGAGKPEEDYGVRDFKAKFGGELVNFGRNVIVHAPLRLKVSTAAYERLSRFL